jgi:hypothetical protein
MVKRLQTTNVDPEENNEISTLTSIFAGIGSGLFKIPEGFVSLGASLMDLGSDTNKAKAVEEWFAEINPFDEAAEATTAGKLTEFIVNIGVPGGIAFKVGNNLAKVAIAGKKAGKYLDSTSDLSKLARKDKIAKFNELAGGMDKVKAFGAGAGLGGVAEGVFVGDVEEAGTFGDLIGGPTEITRRQEYSPETELVNRLKFGIEGVGFTGLIGAAGQAIRMLRNQKGAGKVVEGKWNRFLDKWISQPLRSRGGKTQEYFETKNLLEGTKAADINVSANAAIEIDSAIDKLFPWWKRVIGDKTVGAKKNELLKQMNDLLLSGPGKRGTLQPIYKVIDEIDPKTGKKTGAKVLDVTFEDMNVEKLAAFKESLRKLEIDPDELVGVMDNLNGIRTKWSRLFSSMGRRLDQKGVDEFIEVMDEKVGTWMNSSYEVFKNNPIKPALNYAPSRALIKETMGQFMDIAKIKEINITPLEAESMVNEVWLTAKLPKGFKLNKRSDVEFVIPDFFVGKSFADDIVRSNNRTLADLSGTNRDVIEKLLGKNENALVSIVEGTNRLSAVVRRNEFYDNLVNKSNELLAEGKTPMLVDNPGLARKHLGGTSSDWRMIGSKQINTARQRVAGMEVIDPYIDPKKTLKPLKGELQPQQVTPKGVRDLPILNPLEGKWALNGVVDALEGLDESVMGKGFGSLLYQNLILYPKATSQMAKTILAPFTHARNFLSAGAFAAANGIIPFGDPQAVKKAFQALQTPLYGTAKQNEFYQKLLRLGVVNSQVQLGDLRRLLKDVDFGASVNSIRGLNGLLKRLSKYKKYAQDFYTAEDDFWKIFTWMGETKRLRKAYMEGKDALRLGDEFTDIANNKVRLTEDWLEQEAANLVKNQVPNYAFVSEFIKGLRRWPVGNFVAFPAEIMRTGTNIVARGLDEIFYTTKIGKNEAATPLRSIGLQRLAGMAVTTAAVPYAAVEAGKAIYNVSEDEINAMRRYVADWAKNSTLVPLRDKEGNLEYIDFSHMNAYDTLTRPIQTVINSVQEGREDKDGIMDDFILGLIESTKEIAQPFISESIWTEAFQDIAPVLGRGGRTADGREIYSADKNIDPMGSKVWKSIKHLVKAQAPLNWNQLGRLGLSMRPIDDKGRFDQYGREYEFGNEVSGIVGLRSVKIDPEKSLGYKITDFKKGIRGSRNLFTRATLKGGPITAENVTDAYIRANEALYRVNREMYKDIDAAKVLGTSEDTIAETMQNRGERKAFNALNEGIFRPLTISRDVKQLFELKAEKLGMPNAFEVAGDALDLIRELLAEITVRWDAWPNLINPFRDLPKPNVNAVTNQLPPLPDPTLNTGTQFGNVNTNVSPADQYAALWPHDTLGNLRAQRQRPKQNIVPT